MEELILMRPTVAYGKQILACREEYLEAGSSMDGCGPLRHTADGEEFFRRVAAMEDPATCPPNRVPATQLILVRKDDDKVLGFLQIRHEFNDYLARFGGHIGYSVRPAERRRGYAKAMLGMALQVCRTLGLLRVLITCIDGNVGSERTILANGGVYESTVHEPAENVDLKRFWITL